MNRLIKTLLSIKETLEKALKLPSPKGPKSPTAPSSIQAPSTVDQPTVSPSSKKDPIKQAEQISDKDAQQKALKQIKQNQHIEIAGNGQWKLNTPKPPALPKIK